MAVPFSNHARDTTEPLLTVPGVAAYTVDPAVPLVGLMLGCVVKAGAGVSTGTPAASRAATRLIRTFTVSRQSRADVLFGIFVSTAMRHPFLQCLRPATKADRAEHAIAPTAIAIVSGDLLDHLLEFAGMRCRRLQLIQHPQHQPASAFGDGCSIQYRTVCARTP
jgi:hypothetical protein